MQLAVQTSVHGFKHDVSLKEYLQPVETETHRKQAWYELRCTSVVVGYKDKALLLDCTQASFVLQPADSPPVIERILAYSVDAGSSLETNRYALLSEEPRATCNT